jgi:hypothetical protein
MWFRCAHDSLFRTRAEIEMLCCTNISFVLLEIGGPRVSPENFNSGTALELALVPYHVFSVSLVLDKGRHRTTSRTVLWRHSMIEILMSKPMLPEGCY